MKMAFKRDYLIGGLNGKADPTDYVVGYQADNGMYIEIRSITGETFRWYRVNGKEFEKLKDAKEYCMK